jgi:hypothetical protein
MDKSTGSRVAYIWIVGALSILTLAGSGLCPFGVPLLSDRLSPELLITVALGAALGAALGLFQSFLLRHGRRPSLPFVAYAAAGMALAWLLWSMVGLALSPTLQLYFDAVAPPVNFITAALMAAVLAATQLLAQAPHAADGARWATFTATGWFLAWILCTPAVSAIVPDNSSALWRPLAAAVFGVIFSSATALAFIKEVSPQHSLAA